MKPSIVVVGPKGCGKTHNAARIMRAFGLEKSMDVVPRQPLEPRGVLYLYHDVLRKADAFRIISYDVAMQAVLEYEAKHA